MFRSWCDKVLTLTHIIYNTIIYNALSRRKCLSSQIKVCTEKQQKGAGGEAISVKNTVEKSVVSLDNAYVV